MKQVAIVHYNTPEVTEACIRSIRRHGGEKYRIVVFENSDTKPLPKMDGVVVKDNTEGQLIDFDAVLKTFPGRNVRIGCALGCNYGSVKHMMSVEWLVQNLKSGFVLMDSDTLLREPIDDLFDSRQAAIGQVCKLSPRGIHRLLPFICWLNAPMLRKHGVHYHDEKRSYGLAGDDIDNRANWYDTGASLLEDLRSGTLPWKEEKVCDRIYHLGNGSWRKKNDWKDWLNAHQDVWSDGHCTDERVIKKNRFYGTCRAEVSPLGLHEAGGGQGVPDPLEGYRERVPGSDRSEPEWI